MGEIKDTDAILWKDTNNKRVMNRELAEEHMHNNQGVSIFSKPLKVWQLRQED